MYIVIEYSVYGVSEEASSNGMRCGGDWVANEGDEA